LEKYSDGHSVGTIRGLYMTSINIAWLMGPFLGSILISDTGNYRNTYLASLAILFPLLYLVYRNFNQFHDPHYSHPSPWQLVKGILKHADLAKLFYVNLILQIFYSWMVVYSPIYLNKVIGFNWKEIGVILVFMLLPFVLFEYPLGRLADHKYGEKIIMAIGFGIMGLSTILISVLTLKIFVVWAIIFFVTRTGASMAEIMIETYLFKSINVKDSSILSAFRIARPASFFFSSGIMIIGLNFFDVRYMFVVIGLLVLTALLPSLTIDDIKEV
jgi:predicted MFS family arabinose efflux permease